MMTNKYELVIETTCELSAPVRKKYGIYSDYLHTVLYIPGKDDTLADLEFKNYSPKEFFSIIKKNAGKVRTAFSPFEEYQRVVEPILKAGKDVIIFSISSALSGTVQSYKNFAKFMLTRYPKNKIEVIDTFRYGAASGLLAIYGGINKKNGMSFEENVEWLNTHKYEIHEAGPMDDLFFLAKNKRLSGTKAFFGSLIGVQPFADFSTKGISTALGTIKGDDNSNKVALKYLEATCEDINNSIIIISHSDREERAKLFKDQLLAKYNPVDVITLSVGQSCGPNIGPGLCGYFYFGKKVDDKEAEIFNRIKEAL